jgi:flavin-dependent dehydrogenase
MIETQVCVVGAGPGGCTTAIALAQKGIPCVLVDKAIFPRHKACGEVITSNCIRELAELDRAILTDLENALFKHDIEGNLFVSSENYQFDIAYKSPANERLGLPHCYTASRHDFDNFLLEAVKTRYPSVKIIEGCHLADFETTDDFAILRDKKGEHTIKSKLVIFANGAGNKLTKKATGAKVRKSHEAIGLRAYFKNVVPHPQEKMAEFYFFEKKYMPFGIYITPLQNGVVNVNTWVRKDFVEKKSINIRTLMMDFLKENSNVKERFAEAEMIGKTQGSFLELGSRWWKMSGNRFLQVGDAAGLIDATNANGIGHAMISGRIAANFAEKSIAINDFSEHALKAYDKAMQKRMKNALKLSRMIAPFSRMPYYNTFSAWMMNYWMRKSTDSQLIIKLMYSKNAAKDLIKPSFYYKLFFTKSAKKT